MRIRTLRFSTGLQDENPEQIFIEIKTKKDFQDVKTEIAPAVYLIKMENLDSFLSFGDIFIDRGKKHSSKELSATLLKQEKIPVIRGNYTSTGQLCRSARTLIQNAQDRGERNIYIIGVNVDIFNKLWEKSAVHETLDDKTIDSMDLTFSQAKSMSFSEMNRIAEKKLLRILPFYTVPEELEETFIGRSGSAQLIRRLILMAAEHRESVLILGDTGTGKEVVARAIHRFSPRAHYNFTPVNCGAIPEYLFESELFGYEAGAFTGALTKKIGLWKTADKGTLFLDEIGDLSLNNQVKILRALEDKKIRPIGSTTEIKVDARNITATNKNLSAMVESGEFREDLLYRLMSFQIYTPPLRSNPRDIPEIAQSFWDQITNKTKDPLPPDILNELKAYRWPGNGRELRMVLMKLYTYFRDRKLSSDHLKMIFLLQGQIHAGRIKRTIEQDRLEHRAGYHRHLSRTVEVLRAIKVALRPALAGAPVTPQSRTSIHSIATTQLAELDILCLRPDLFQKKETYDRVRKLKDLYMDFLPILKKSVKKAREYWESRIDAEYEKVMGLLFIKIEELIQ